VSRCSLSMRRGAVARPAPSGPWPTSPRPPDGNNPRGSGLVAKAGLIPAGCAGPVDCDSRCSAASSQRRQPDPYLGNAPAEPCRSGSVWACQLSESWRAQRLQSAGVQPRSLPRNGGWGTLDLDRRRVQAASREVLKTPVLTRSETGGRPCEGPNSGQPFPWPAWDAGCPRTFPLRRTAYAVEPDREVARSIATCRWFPRIGAPLADAAWRSPVVAECLPANARFGPVLHLS